LATVKSRVNVTFGTKVIHNGPGSNMKTHFDVHLYVFSYKVRLSPQKATALPDV
jgi:hypothetical protein